MNHSILAALKLRLAFFLRIRRVNRVAARIVSRSAQESDVSLDEATFSDMRTRMADRLQRSIGDADSSYRVLLISSNGAGLGHLTRISSIRRWLRSSSIVYTMSSAYRKTNLPLSDVVYFPSFRDLGMNGREWNKLMEYHLRSVVEGYNPSAMVFDGTYVYKGVVECARKLEIPLIWIQRGCWKSEVDARSFQRHNADTFCSRVIIPGDFGCEETIEVGGYLKPSYVGPITYIEPTEMLSREDARMALGLPLNKKLFLVQPGAGVINDISDLKKQAIRYIRDLGSEWEHVEVRNPLSTTHASAGGLSIEAFPLSKYFLAFDSAIFAGGYNSVQESIRFGLPAVFVPNLDTKTDDQLYRVRQVEDEGLGLCATNSYELKNCIAGLASEERRNAIRRNQFEVKCASGAREAAKLIDDIVSA